MQFKKNRAILAAVVAAAMASTALMSATVSAAGVGHTEKRTAEEKYGKATYAARFLSMYEDVIVNGQKNGYLSTKNVAEGGFGIPYHSVEELICEAPDYGHETTSEAMSYIVWLAAMHDNIVTNGNVEGAVKENHLGKAWKTLEALIPSKEQQPKFMGANLSSQVSAEHPHNIGDYPSEGSQSNVGKNPIHSELSTAYSSEGREYLLHWLADVDDWYGFGGSSEGTLGTFTFINTFQRGDQESCFETIPHPAIETLKYGNSTQGMKFAFQNSTAESWSYTNAPDAEDRAIQAVYAANRWGVEDKDVSAKAAMMGDMCRNDMFDKYYKTLGCQSYTADSNGGGLDGQHFLMSWYTAWGGAADGAWAWQIGCSHSHQFYQNPLAAYGLLYDSGLNKAMKTSDATKDYTTSLQRQLELYLWLQSANGPFAGGCTNCWEGNYGQYPSDVPTFYDMAYIEHPVYADPGSNHWTGNQFWATQRLAELYYLVCTDGDASGGAVKPGGMSIKEALKTVLDRWVEFFVTKTEIDEDKGDYSVPASLDWTGKPDQNWTESSKYSGNSGLTCEITAMGHSDIGCACSLADTLIYYAKANGVEASGTVEKGSSLPENALYTGQRLLDYVWKNGRDDIGVCREDTNKSLARMLDQVVYIPEGASGKYPGGYTVQHGSTFFDLRPMYKDVPGWKALEDAYNADKDKGAAIVESTTGTNCDAFENVGNVTLAYHRFWHEGDVMMGLGAMAELYPDVTPIDAEGGVKPPQPTEADWGNVDESEGATVEDRVKVADAVMLARIVANDKTVNVTAQGRINANVEYDEDGVLDTKDLTKLLKYLAGTVEYSKLGKQA